MKCLSCRYYSVSALESQPILAMRRAASPAIGGGAVMKLVLSPRGIMIAERLRGSDELALI